MIKRRALLAAVLLLTSAGVLAGCNRSSTTTGPNATGTTASLAAGTGTSRAVKGGSKTTFTTLLPSPTTGG